MSAFKRHPSSIAALLDKYKRVGLSVEPTPICELPRLSAQVGHRVYVLREDLTGFALGGNKVRKLEYLIGDAITKEADTLIAVGACSFTRNAAAAGKAFGFEVHLVIAGDESDHNQASHALLQRFGATLHYVPGIQDTGLTSRYDELVARLRAEGRVVYELYPGGSDPIGALGYLHVFDHIVRYTKATQVHFDKIILPTGSTGTQVGLLLGQIVSQYDTRVIGMAISQPTDIQRKRVIKLATSTAEMLGMTFDESTVHVDDRFLGGGYAIPSGEGEEAVRTLATQEGLLLDQVYTGKAAAGLIYHATHGQFDADDNILFVHTGGNSGLFY